MLTVGSICTGYGGLELALDHAAIPHRLEWVSEIDPTANTVLAHHWPDVPNLGDITNANPTPVDLITAGFPCQDISQAGRQAGIHGDRSGLWWTIRDVIGHLRPRYVLLENVAAINVNGGPAVVASLTGLGYDCRWGIVRAADAGAPHQRRRWFCLAWNTGSEGLEGPGLRRAATQRHSHTADTDRTGGPQPFTLTRRSDTPIATHDQRPVTDPDSVGRQSERGGSLQPGQRDTNRRNRQTFGRYAAAVERWERLTRPAPPPQDIAGRLNPRFVEWMMGLPDQWVDHGTRAAQLRVLGNGVVPQQAALAINQLSTPIQAGSGVLA